MVVHPPTFSVGLARNSGTFNFFLFGVCVRVISPIFDIYFISIWRSHQASIKPIMAKNQDIILLFKSTDWLRLRSLRDQATRQSDLYLITVYPVVCSAQQWRDSLQSQYQLQLLGPVQGPRDQPNGHWAVMILNLSFGQHPPTNPCSLALARRTGGSLVLLSQGPALLETDSPGLSPENQLLYSTEQASGNHIGQV